LATTSWPGVTGQEVNGERAGPLRLVSMEISLPQTPQRRGFRRTHSGPGSGRGPVEISESPGILPDASNGSGKRSAARTRR